MHHRCFIDFTFETKQKAQNTSFNVRGRKFVSKHSNCTSLHRDEDLGGAREEEVQRTLSLKLCSCTIAGALGCWFSCRTSGQQRGGNCWPTSQVPPQVASCPSLRGEGSGLSQTICISNWGHPHNNNRVPGNLVGCSVTWT